MPKSNDKVLNKKSAVLVNGQWGDSKFYSDRGLHFGDGFFETVLINDGRAPLWPLHLARLSKALDILGIDASPNAVETNVNQFLSHTSGPNRYILKIIVTRGFGGGGYSPLGSTEPQIILQAKTFEKKSAYSIDGIQLRTCRVQLPLNKNLAGIKHLSRLDYVLAAKDFGEVGQHQPLLLDTQEYIVESLHHNVFFVSDDYLHTPDLSYCGVAGVMREFILSLDAKALQSFGIKGIKTQRYTKETLMESQEAFICNSVRGVWPVAAVEDIKMPIGSVTRKLQQWIVRELGEVYEC